MVPLQADQGLLMRNKVQNLFELFQRLFWLQGNEDSRRPAMSGGSTSCVGNFVVLYGCKVRDVEPNDTRSFQSEVTETRVSYEMT